MAVYTHVPANEVVDLLHGYDLGLYENHTGITEGVENTNYLLKTDRGKFILTVFEKRIQRDDLPFIFAYTNHLRHWGITVPDTYADRAGHTVSTLMGKPAAIIRFLDGAGVKDAEITPDYCAQLGNTLARMHNAAGAFRDKRENPVGLKQWKHLLTEAFHKTDILHANDIAAIDEAISDYEGMPPHHLPRGAVHADLFPDNVFFKNGELRGVIDFYFACTDYLAYDIAMTVNAWCLDKSGKLDADRLKAFANAYEAERQMTDEERDLFPTLRRAAALRILSTRLYDWVFTPAGADVVKKDPLEYVAKLKADVKWP